MQEYSIYSTLAANFVSLESESGVCIQSNALKNNSQLYVPQYVQYAYWIKLTQDVSSKEQEMFSVFILEPTL